ncbi:AAA family ATPase [Plebeiibacterium sediminum]|uniref:ATP-dependent Clp protease ATP-binding subunit n=1 Tax=Plebeiibacterium sediminum TaxID=2992112 RepID=A0AAE3M7W0_9BACT|nr:ATP-dependent Clp protease ATP-binding subunit [Plebeiobacterium sediminum]MCW3788879.1 ATP-dependent Clp protease ATP-binding subunit [Plebeiobacterium sediminum]
MRYNEELFSPETINAFEIASLVAIENKHPEIQPAHLLTGLLHKGSKIKDLLFANDIDIFYLEEWAEVKMAEYDKCSTIIDKPAYNKSVILIIEEALNISKNFENELLTPIYILASLATPGVGFSHDELKTFIVTSDQIISLRENSSHLPSQPENKKIVNQPDYLINLLSTNFQDFKVIGRDQEILHITEIIGRKNKPNVVITGEKGIGKSKLIQGIVSIIKEKKTSTIFQHSMFFELDTNLLVSGITHKGELEERLRKIFNYLNNFKRPILFIDEIQIILDDPNNGKSIYFLLKNQLSKSNSIIICTASNEAYLKLFEKDNPLQNYFERFQLDEPDQERSTLMIYANKKLLESHHKISIDRQSIKEAVKLAKRFLPESQLPDSAIMLLDSTMSSIRTQLDTIPSELAINKNRLTDKNFDNNSIILSLKRLLKYTGLEAEENIDIKNCNEVFKKIQSYIETRQDCVNHTDLANTIGRIRKIPVGKIVTKERERLLNMEDILHKTVIGQSIAISTICDAILESRSGLNKPGLPIGSFFFLGPTGTGKTELAKQLAQYLFQSKESLIRFDMSEFKEEHSAALLYGAPPGYVGYEEGGMLVNKIRQKPYSVVLFDEIEKAHPSVFDIFLQILDEGKLHDRLGKTGDFSNAIILFTSNIGSEKIIKQFNNSGNLPNQTTLMEDMASYFRPEFLGRITGLVPFSPITENMIERIFDIQISELEESLLQHKIILKIDDEARSLLAREGYNPQYGARPLRGIIRTKLKTPLSRMIIREEIKKGCTIQICLTEKMEIKLNVVHKNEPVTIDVLI